MEQAGLWAGFFLTLMVFSYLLGDNPLYRLAVNLFAGLAAGHIAIVTWEGVIAPWLRATVLSGSADTNQVLTGALPLLLGLLLLLKAVSSRGGSLGNLALAFLIGIGVAVALVGAIRGTLIPLATTTGRAVDANLVNGLLLLLGVIATLVHFQYLARRRTDGSAQRRPHIQALALLGQAVIVITLGAVYAAAILSALTIFSERLGFLVRQAQALLGPGTPPPA